MSVLGTCPSYRLRYPLRELIVPYQQYTFINACRDVKGIIFEAIFPKTTNEPSKDFLGSLNHLQ